MQYNLKRHLIRQRFLQFLVQRSAIRRTAAADDACDIEPPWTQKTPSLVAILQMLMEGACQPVLLCYMLIQLSSSRSSRRPGDDGGRERGVITIRSSNEIIVITSSIFLDLSEVARRKKPEMCDVGDSMHLLGCSVSQALHICRGLFSINWGPYPAIEIARKVT